MFQAAPDHHNNQNKSRWLSWSNTRFSRNKHGIKTFPVDPSVSEKKMKMKMKMNEKIKNKRRLPATKNRSNLELKSAEVSSNGQHIRASSSDQNPAATGKVSSDEAPEETPQEEKITRENKKRLDLNDAPKDGLCQFKRLPFGRKISAGQPGSPDDKPNSSGTTATTCTTTVPAPTHQKPATSPAVLGRVMVKKPQKANGGMVEVKQNCLSPEIGLSIIMVTLMVLFLHGSFFAIVCTCAFFYFIPRLRAAVGQLDAAGKDHLVSDHLDFSSKEYKKKVILEGLLDRSHRSL